MVQHCFRDSAGFIAAVDSDERSKGVTDTTAAAEGEGGASTSSTDMLCRLREAAKKAHEMR